MPTRVAPAMLRRGKRWLHWSSITGGRLVWFVRRMGTLKGALYEDVEPL